MPQQPPRIINPYMPALPPDFRYRDMCVAGADLPVTTFDPFTGEEKSEEEDIYYAGSNINNINDYTYGDAVDGRPVSLYDQRYTGVVLGAKPTQSQCMPMRDTPLTDVESADPNLAFAYYMNMDDANVHDLSRVLARQKDVYGNTNYYKNTTFFIDGVSGCPGAYPSVLDYVSPQPKFERNTIQQRLEFRRWQANWCYKYFLLSHDNSPWFTMERPGIGTQDPLSKVDPNRSYLNNCQPLINGLDAAFIEFGDDATTDRDKKSGYATVWRYKIGDPTSPPPTSPPTGIGDLALDTHNEDEYLLSMIVQDEWDNAFVRVSPGPEPYLYGYPKYQLKRQFKYTFPAVELPCILDRDLPVPPPVIILPPPSETPPPPPTEPWIDVHFPPQCGYGGYDSHGFASQYESYENYDSSYDSCQPMYFPLPPDYWTPLHPRAQYYCPNVEKITVPAENPFIPRNYIVGMDRDYSAATSVCLKDPTNCDPKPKFYWGYTDWNGEGECELSYGGRDIDWRERNEYAVECAIVPVDILSFRAQPFNACIMQRINFNLNAFIQLWVETGVYPDPAHADGSGFNPPCKTRFFESDTYDDCPVKLSIQQCCHIIIKDLVPANFVKLRAKEGLRHERVQCDKVHNPDTGKPVYHIIDDWYGYVPAVDQFMGDGKAALHAAMCDTEKLTACNNGYQTEPQDYMFTSYFRVYHDESSYGGCDGSSLLGYNMPYMRWWDTGVSHGNPRHGGSFLNTVGSWDTLIGVGREEITDEDIIAAQEMEDLVKTLTYYGINGLPPAPPPPMPPLPPFNDCFGEDSTDDGDGDEWMCYGLVPPPPASPPPPPPPPFSPDVGTWTRLDIKTRRAEMGRVGGLPELYAHAMWSLRMDNNFCVARYEKAFKPAGAENFVLAKSGSGYTSRGKPGSDILPREWPWLLGWRGYITAAQSTPFPDLFGPADPGALIQGGLDKALPGDIITFTLPGKLPHIAYVTEVHVGEYQSLEWVNVVFWDQNKYPTSAASTIMMGMGPERSIYKENVPTSNRQEVCNKTFRVLTSKPGSNTAQCNDASDMALNPGTCMASDCQPSCIDTDYRACILGDDGGGANMWDNVTIYRRVFDVRQCGGTPTNGFDDRGNAMAYDLGATYNWWWGDSDLPNVVYQYRTNKMDTDLWAWCVNQGYDPPSHWAPNFEYKGAQTGAQTKLFFCGPFWGNCSQDSTARYFPGTSGR